MRIAGIDYSTKAVDLVTIPHDGRRGAPRVAHVPAARRRRVRPGTGRRPRDARPCQLVLGRHPGDRHRTPRRQPRHRRTCSASKAQSCPVCPHGCWSKPLPPGEVAETRRAARATPANTTCTIDPSTCSHPTDRRWMQRRRGRRTPTTPTSSPTPPAHSSPHPRHRVTPLEQLLRDTNPDNLDWDTQRIWKAMVLAPNLQVFAALLAGQDVPRTAMDDTWTRKLGV